MLGGQPLFAVHYLMAKKHWQIVNHDRAGKPQQGGIKTFTLKEAPPLVVETAVRAARCIGDGLYGVDLKETKDGVFVIEVNDNPEPRPWLGGFGREGRGLDPTDAVVPRPAGPARTVAR